MIELDVQEVPRLKAPRIQKVYYAYYDYEHGEPHPVIRIGVKCSILRIWLAQRQ